MLAINQSPVMIGAVLSNSNLDYVPPQRPVQRGKKYLYAGMKMTIAELAEMSGKDKHLIRNRLDAEWSVANAVEVGE